MNVLLLGIEVFIKIVKTIIHSFMHVCIERIKIKVKRLYALAHSFLDSFTEEEKRDLIKIVLFIVFFIVAVLVIYFYGIPALQSEVPKPIEPHMHP